MTGAVDGYGEPVWMPGNAVATRYAVEAATVEHKGNCAIFWPVMWVWAFWARPSACPPTTRPDFCGMAMGDPYFHICSMAGSQRLYWLPDREASWGPLLDAIREDDPSLDEGERESLGAYGVRLDEEADAAQRTARSASLEKPVKVLH